MSKGLRNQPWTNAKKDGGKGQEKVDKSDKDGHKGQGKGKSHKGAGKVRTSSTNVYATYANRQTISRQIARIRQKVSRLLVRRVMVRRR